MTSQVIVAEADSTLDRHCIHPVRKITRLPDTYFGEYKILAILGKGAFNEAYLGVHHYTGEEVAIKVERSNASHKQLYHELTVYQKIGSDQEGFPKILFYESNFFEPVSGNTLDLLCMERLGDSLSSMFQQCYFKFRMDTVLKIAMQGINRLYTLHSRGIIHRDVKPDNLLIGLGAYSSVIHLIDYGMSIEYWDKEKNEHVPLETKQRSVGTLRYSSINTHLGILQSRRDDLETLGYVLVYFLLGRLPWTFNEHMTPEQRHQAVYISKSTISPEELCSGLPKEFAMYLRYCRMLQYDETPNYGYLKGLFRNAAGSMNILLDDGVFEWNCPAAMHPENIDHSYSPWNN